MSDNFPNNQTIQAYDKGVDKYIAAERKTVDGSLVEWFGRALSGLDKTAHILEIGSASGRDANYVESLGYTVERTDASQGFVERLQKNGHEVRVLNVLVDDLGDEYDLVYANAVFLHFDDDDFKTAIQKTYNALRPGGHFALSLKRGSGSEVTSTKLDNPRYFRYWEPDEVKEVLENVGFINFKEAVGDDWREDKPQWLFITVEKGDK